ncbi:MAG TPA: hypothetical protein VEN30_17075 [Paraburkholderia sp.]|nr:hypothetical protein [Paraburkholderia sp.]
MKSRTPSDFAIVAIFRDKRKPQNAARSAFPLDFMENPSTIWRRFRPFARRLAPPPSRTRQARHDNSAPTYVRAAIFMRRIKIAALVDRF